MIIDKHLLDNLTEQAKHSPRLRMHYDLRNSSDDSSQRMLNAIEPGTKMVIHRHLFSSETVVCLRGHFQEFYYDDDGNVTEVINMVPGGVMLDVPMRQWHRLVSLETGTVLFECKNGAYSPLCKDEIFEGKEII